MGTAVHKQQLPALLPRAGDSGGTGTCPMTRWTWLARWRRHGPVRDSCIPQGCSDVTTSVAAEDAFVVLSAAIECAVAVALQGRACLSLAELASATAILLGWFRDSARVHGIWFPGSLDCTTHDLGTLVAAVRGAPGRVTSRRPGA